MRTVNVHPNASVQVPPTHRRMTHKQQIALQTTTDNARHGRGKYSSDDPNRILFLCILKTTRQ